MANPFAWLAVFALASLSLAFAVLAAPLVGLSLLFGRLARAVDGAASAHGR